MPRVLLKEGTTIDDLENTLSLISIKICKLSAQMEVHRGYDFLPPKEKLMLNELYAITNRHFNKEDPDDDWYGLYSPDEVDEFKKMVEGE